MKNNKNLQEILEIFFRKFLSSFTKQMKQDYSTAAFQSLNQQVMVNWVFSSLNKMNTGWLFPYVPMLLGAMKQNLLWLENWITLGWGSSYTSFIPTWCQDWILALSSSNFIICQDSDFYKSIHINLKNRDINYWEELEWRFDKLIHMEETSY